MPVVYGVCERYILLIPAIVACLVAANQEQCRPARVKCIEDAIRPSVMLNAQLTHVPVTRRRNSGRMRHLQGRTNCLQKADYEVNALLFGCGQSIPPVAELTGEFDFPRQTLVCHIRHYVVKSILR